MEPGDVIADRFVLERLAGAGGMGTVWRAIDRATQQIIALKIMRARLGGVARDRFSREAKALAHVRHPSIVGFIATGVTQRDEPYLAMTWVDGEELGKRLEKGPIPESELVAIARGLASALGALHAAGVIHRDVKPTNVMLVGGDARHPVLVDFGVAHIDNATRALTVAGALLGTPGYMSPEQARGEPVIDARADVYALGAMLFECASGRTPFVAAQPIALLAKCILEDPPRLAEHAPSIDPRLAALVDRMISRDASQRPANGACVLELLDTQFGNTIASGPRLSLTPTERRLASLVVALPRDATGPVDAMPTLATASSVEDLSEQTGVRVVRLVDGTILCVVEGEQDLVAQTTRAARAALALRNALPNHAHAYDLALVTGTAVVAGPVPLGELVEHAIALARAPGHGIRIDGVTAGVLAERFDIRAGHRDDDEQTEGALVLVGESSGGVAEPRLVMGRPTPFVGREREMAILRAAFETCAEEGQPTLALVTGEPGVGKTRLRHELIRALREEHGDDIAIWTTRGDPLSSGSPWSLTAQAARSIIGIFPDDDEETRRTKIQNAVGATQRGAARDQISAFVGELVHARFSDTDSPLLRAARRDPFVLGEQIVRAIEMLVSARVSMMPLVLVTDDLQWGDVPSVSVLRRLVRSAESAPFFVFALGRPETRDRFPELFSDENATEVRLGPLSARACDKLVRSFVGDDVVAKKIISRSGGNPLFLEELLRDGASGAPETLRAVVQARIELCESEERRVLRAASIFGERFRARGVAALSGSDPAIACALLDSLVRRELLVVDESRGAVDANQYAFRQDIVREAAYDMLTSGDRVTGHLLAARHLEEEGEGTDPLVLASHYELGGAVERAAQLYLLAAEQALAGNDLARARELAERGEHCQEASGTVSLHTIGSLRAVVSEVHRFSGDSRVALDTARVALDLLDPQSDRAYAVCASITSLAARIGDHESVLFGHARLIEPGPWSNARVVAALRATTQLAVIGEHELADALLAEAERAHAQLGATDPIAHATLDVALAQRAQRNERLAESLALRARAIERFTSAGDVRSALQHRTSLAWTSIRTGLYDDAEAQLASVIEEADRVGLTSIAEIASLVIAYARLDRGSVESAQKALARAIAGAERQASNELRGQTCVLSSRLAEMRGDLATSEADARRGAQLLANEPSIRLSAESQLGHVLVARGRHEAALAVLRSVMSAIERGAPIDEGAARARVAYARALIALDRRDEATRHLADANAWLDAREAQLEHPAWRDAFRAIPIHRELRAIRI